MQLDAPILQELRTALEELRSAGKLPSKEQLKEYHDAFRRRFAPEHLQNLDGEALLRTMHDHSNTDSLVYWLEWKNDDEFPSSLFGGIVGGSALKFRIYRRKDTGEWMTGSSKSQQVISTEEAVNYARLHRDQLASGADLLAQFETDGSDEDYRGLQEQMNSAAPNLADLAWSHKYFSLLFPEKLDQYHSAFYQHFHLIRLLQMPPEGEGRYLSAGRFVSLARELQIPMTWLDLVLQRRNGGWHRYWRIGTTNGSGETRWPEMRDGRCVAVGWPKLGNIIELCNDPDAINKLKEQIAEHYQSPATSIGRSARQLYRFIKVISERDLVIAMDGAKVLGIGRVTGDAYFDDSSDFRFRRPVDWLNLDEWKLPEMEGIRTTVHECRKEPNLLAIQRRIAGAAPPPPPPNPPVDPKPPIRLSGICGRIQAILERKGQVILYGPPGTGKTYWAERVAKELAAAHEYRKPFDELSEQQKAAILGDHNGNGLVRFCCFHPAYGYEDFLEGYRPEQTNGQMTFVLRPGVFRKLCEDAGASPHRHFFLIIDEINRGDIPRIFGELLTVLEKNKRGKMILLPLTGTAFHVPANVFVIGTMNTADRSIALLDAALRRRFGFVELMPDSGTLGNAVVNRIPLGAWLDALNQRICEHLGQDARNLQIGHSYFLEREKPISDFGRLVRVLHEDLVPLLEEYCYDNYGVLKEILGSRLVNSTNQTIRHEIFDPERRDELASALLALLAARPEIATAVPEANREVEQDATTDDPDEDVAEGTDPDE